MVARDQVNNDAGPQGGDEGAPVIGHFGLLPRHHLQQNDTKQVTFQQLHKHVAAKILFESALLNCAWIGVVLLATYSHLEE